ATYVAVLRHGRIFFEDRKGSFITNGMTRGVRFRIPAVFLFLVIAVIVCAQEAPRFRVDVPLVSLDVGVLDSTGRPVTNLTADDFTVYEDGDRREIKNFSPVETPYHMLALFDCTGSTREAWPFLLKSLNGFLTSLRPQDRIAVLAFGGGTSVVLNWTSCNTRSDEHTSG